MYYVLRKNPKSPTGADWLGASLDLNLARVIRGFHGPGKGAGYDQLFAHEDIIIGQSVWDKYQELSPLVLTYIRRKEVLFTILTDAAVCIDPNAPSEKALEQIESYLKEWRRTP